MDLLRSRRESRYTHPLRSISALIVTLAMAASALLAQQPSAGDAQNTPTFRVAVRYIEVDAVVRDSKDQFIPDLTSKDFVILEDGKPQTIDKVTFVDLPPVDPSSGIDPFVTQSPLQPERPDSLASYEEGGRLYVMVLGPGDLSGVRRIASLFIERYLGAKDRLAILDTDGTVGEALTTDKARLLNAVDRYRGGAASGETMLRTLRDVAIGLGSVTGRRKSIVFIGDPFGVQLWAREIGIDKVGLNEERSAFLDMTRTARTYNVPIHTISPVGLYVPWGALASGEERNVPVGVLAPNREAPFELEWIPLGLDVDHVRRGISADTGGFDLGTINSATKGLARLVRENSRYYIVGYYSSVERDGRAHPITVRVSRPGAKVDARRNIRALRPVSKGQAELPRTLSRTARVAFEGMPIAGQIPVRGAAMLFRGDDYKASLLVEAQIDSRGLNLEAGQKIQFSAAAIDPSGAVRAVVERAFTLDLRTEARARVDEHGLKFFERLLVPYGTYDVRIVVEQPGREAGVTTVPVTVPDFADGTLFFSDVLVGSKRAGSLVLTADSQLRDDIPGSAILDRRFPAGEELSLFVEVYDTHWFLSPNVGVRWSIRAADEKIMARGELETGTSRAGRAQFRGQVQGVLLEGRYSIDLEAFSISGAPASTRTSVSLDIVGRPRGGAQLQARKGDTFEAVSIRRIPPPCPFITLDLSCDAVPRPRRGWALLPGGRLELTNQPGIDIVRVAYNLEGLDSRFVNGGPNWLNNTHYDITALTGRDGLAADPPSEVDQEVRGLMRQLLKDRFKLRTTVKTKTVNVKLLRRISGPLAPTLRPSLGDCPATSARAPGMYADILNCPGTYTRQGLDLRSITMAELARVFSKRLVSVPVLDETGLTGSFDVLLGSGNIDQQVRRLGLELESAKRTFDFVTIEGAEKPIED